MKLTAEDFIYANGVPMSPERAAEQANSFIGLTPKNIVLSKPVGTVYRVGLGDDAVYFKEREMAMYAAELLDLTITEVPVH